MHKLITAILITMSMITITNPANAEDTALGDYYEQSKTCALLYLRVNNLHNYTTANEINLAKSILTPNQLTFALLAIDEINRNTEYLIDTIGFDGAIRKYEKDHLDNILTLASVAKFKLVQLQCPSYY